MSVETSYMDDPKDHLAVQCELKSAITRIIYGLSIMNDHIYVLDNVRRVRKDSSRLSLDG